MHKIALCINIAGSTRNEYNYITCNGKLLYEHEFINAIPYLNVINCFAKVVLSGLSFFLFHSKKLENATVELNETFAENRALNISKNT